jgi:hypothetical protein
MPQTELERSPWSSFFIHPGCSTLSMTSHTHDPCSHKYKPQQHLGMLHADQQDRVNDKEPLPPEPAIHLTQEARRHCRRAQERCFRGSAFVHVVVVSVRGYMICVGTHNLPHLTTGHMSAQIIFCLGMLCCCAVGWGGFTDSLITGDCRVTLHLVFWLHGSAQKCRA